jgi:hypothetical protein
MSSFHGAPFSRKWTAYTAIAGSQVRSGDVVGARATIDDIPPSSLAEVAFRGVVAAQICSGDGPGFYTGKLGPQYGVRNLLQASVYLHAVNRLFLSDRSADIDFMEGS